MRVIFAGLGRTGTQSLVAACRTLGLSTLSQEELFADLPVMEHVLRSAQGLEPLDVGRLPSADAAVGWPMCYHHATLRDAFPDVRCVLNVRDPNAWFDSVMGPWKVLGPLQRVSHTVRCLAPLRAVGGMADALVHELGGPPDRDRWTAAVRARNEAIIQAWPSDRLQVWNLGDGWGPICGFLGLPEPSVPFPRGNEGSATFQARLSQILTGRHRAQ